MGLSSVILQRCYSFEQSGNFPNLNWVYSSNDCCVLEGWMCNCTSDLNWRFEGAGWSRKHFPSEEIVDDQNERHSTQLSSFDLGFSIRTRLSFPSDIRRVWLFSILLEKIFLSEGSYPASSPRYSSKRRSRAFEHWVDQEGFVKICRRMCSWSFNRVWSSLQAALLRAKSVLSRSFTPCRDSIAEKISSQKAPKALQALCQKQCTNKSYFVLG